MDTGNDHATLGPAAQCCDTKYPIILVHGAGSREGKRQSSWGRIPAALKKAGAQVYTSDQDAWGTIEENAEAVKVCILAALSDAKKEKINAVALSKGGLEMRYLISKLGMADKIASLTTIATPHHGSKTMDYLFKEQDSLLKSAASFVDSLYKLQGDVNPNFYAVCQQLTTAHSERFNREVLDAPNVYYQSYASMMKRSNSDMLLFMQHAVVKMFDGASDGIVSVDSAKWGEFKGVITAKGIRGVSHSDLRDFRRVGPAGQNVANIYVSIVSDLKELGY